MNTVSNDEWHVGRTIINSGRYLADFRAITRYFGGPYRLGSTIENTRYNPRYLDFPWPCMIRWNTDSQTVEIQCVSAPGTLLRSKNKYPDPVPAPDWAWISSWGTYHENIIMYAPYDWEEPEMQDLCARAEADYYYEYFGEATVRGIDTALSFCK